MIGRVTGLAGTAIGAAAASALCCAGPIIGAVTGVGGTALASAVAAFRPLVLAVASVALLGGLWLDRREAQRACQPGVACASPARRRRASLVLSLSAVLTLLLASYPAWRQRL